MNARFDPADAASGVTTCSGVTVLMSTHRGETAANLRDSLESLYGQTLPPGRIVLVVDGPVGEDQEAVRCWSRCACPPMSASPPR